MTSRRKYLKKRDATVVAVQLDLDTDGFTYRKWGDRQTCKAGDWLVDNGGDIYTVDRETFERTYSAVSSGRYAKITPVWAESAARDGQISTQEGITHYKAGDYIVFNEPDGDDGYAVRADTFLEIYEPTS